MKTCKCGKRAYALFRFDPKFVRKLGDWVEVGHPPHPLCNECLNRLCEKSQSRNYCYWIIELKDRA